MKTSRRKLLRISFVFLVLLFSSYLCAAQPCPVNWTNTIGVSVSGNNLTKTTEATGWGDAGASSIQLIISGDGYVESTVGENNTYRMFGLSSGDTDQNYTDIDFALHMTVGATLYIYERGVSRGSFGTYASGDVLRVAIEGGVVKYRKNGALLYTSSGVPTYPLLVDTAFYSPSSTIKDVIIGGPQPTPTPTPTPTPPGQADLSISIDDSDDPVESGNVLGYNITVTNSGPSTAVNVTITDSLPTNFTFLLASSGCNYADSTVTCAIGDLANGASASVQILGTPKITGVGTTIMNTASVTGAGSDPSTPNTSSETTAVAAPTTFNASQIYFDANNNTGFGTTSPIFNDDGVTGANVGKYFAIDGVTPGAAAYLGLGGYITNPTDRVGLLNFYNRAQGGVDGRTATIASYNDGALGKGNLVFATVPNNVGPLARMIIDSQGNVAINRPHAGIGATLALGGQSINDTTYPLVAYNSQGQAVLILTSGGKLGIGSVNFPKESLQVGPSAQFSVNSSGRLSIGAPGEGIILKSPNGLVCSKLTINNSGVLTTEIVTCPNP